MREKKDEKQAGTHLPVYESQPPIWLPHIHGDADLGYPGFHPPRPGQDEDVLSEANIKNGFILAQPVSVETFSAQTMINEKLNSGDTLPKLEHLMNEVFIRRSEQIPLIPPSSFRMPTRVTLNDAKRQAWFADLANPDVPLHKLGKSVPHGAKGHDLLDLLQSNNVAIPRAVWVLRVFGANETAGLRNKPSYNPTQYSVDWANVVTGYIKKQLQEIALPSAPRPGLNIKQTFKGVLADSDSRERWISRFTYCLKLLRTFYAEGLVDNRTFLVWLVQQMGNCNLAQAGFVAHLTDEYLEDILKLRALARALVEACLAKLCEICTTSAQEYLVDTEQLLKIVLQRLCLAIPDAFVSPRLWSAYSASLENVMNHNLLDLPDSSDARYLEQSVRDLRQALLSNLADIKKRNHALSFREPPNQVSAKLGMAVSDVKVTFIAQILSMADDSIQLLNSISSDTEMKKINFFTGDLCDSTTFADKLDMLMTWSVTPLQYGDHRPLAAVTIIRTWRDKSCERASRRGGNDPNDFLQDQLFDWLDASDIAGESGNIRAVALLYGKLVKHELFSYAKYIQRLIARGEQGLAYSEDVASRHRHFLSWIPLFNSTPSLINQRRVTLYGVRARDTPEELTERQIRKEIRAVLPGLFGGDAHTSWSSTSILLANCKTLTSASRFEQVRTFRQWLLPIFQKCIASAAADQSHPLLLKSYHISVELMDYSKCFHSILDLTLCLLLHTTDVETMFGVIDTLLRYAAIWSCMDVVSTIVTALDSAHQMWKSRGVQSRPLLSLLMELDGGRYLNEASRNRTMTDILTFANALQPAVERSDPVPEVLPEILLLLRDSDSNAPSTLANTLWIKYRMSSDWALKVWSNTIASLQHIADAMPDLDVRQNCALRYGTLLWRVDQHLASGLDGYVLRWFLDGGKNGVASLSKETWGILEFILLHLVIHGALRTTTILDGLVYPAWQLAASQDPVEPVAVTYLTAANTICHRLLLQEEGGESPPQDLLDLQCLRTRRQSVYFEPHFPYLVGNIPTLIALENNETLPKELREEFTSLRRQLCQNSGFREGAYRNLDVIRDAFENSPYLMDTSCESLRKDVIAGLRMILWDSGDDSDVYDWPEVSCLLSPWKLAATTIQMQFQIRQLGRALGQEATQDLASANLDKLTTMLFHSTKTSEEAYYVGEMARGAEDTVATKFVKNGLKCISDLLSDTSVDNESFSQCLARVGELFRVLIHVTMPFRDFSAALPALDISVHDHFFQVLYIKITQLESLITASAHHSRERRCDLILLARLLQFILNFRCTSWTAAMKDVARKLGNTLFSLALHYGSGNEVDSTLYPFLIDTLLCVYDEIPHDAKSISFDPLRHYPDVQQNVLPPDLPSVYRKQILTLISRNPPTPVVSNLVNSHRDSHGNLVLGGSVANRPWEWVENLGEPATDSKEEKDREERDRLSARHLIKNSGSLSLDIFEARLTGDTIIRNLAIAVDPKTEGDLHSFEDGLSSESLFMRDWRETRLAVEVEPSSEHAQQIKAEMSQPLSGSVYNASMRLETRPTPKHSPASSIISNLSKRQQSPSQGSSNHRLSTSTMSDIIDMDSLPTGAARKEVISKRKAVVSDDEVEIVEGPVATRSSAAKRARTTKTPAGKTTAKTRGKKK